MLIKVKKKVKIGKNWTKLIQQPTNKFYHQLQYFQNDCLHGTNNDRKVKTKLYTITWCSKIILSYSSFCLKIPVFDGDNYNEWLDYSTPEIALT